jgi:hypothetical protein
VSHHAKASSAGSTTRQASRLGRNFRGALATRGVASRANGSRVPSARLALATAVALLAALVLDVTLANAALPPTVLAGTNTPEVEGNAVLRGFVDPHNSALTDCHFAYSEDESFSQSAPCEPTPGAVNGPVEVEAHLTELEPGTTYHYRLLADSGVGGPVASEATAFEAFQEPSASTNCPNAATRTAQHSAFLPDCRAYEMVSPPDKNGGDVLLSARRTRVAADGNAYSFASLSGFGDVHMLYAGTDYLSQRSTDPEPGNSGWSTHGIAPQQATGTFLSTLLTGEPLYQGFFSEDLNEGIFDANLPLTEDENVAKARNLYLRTDLRTPGLGTYQLLTGCPLCAETSTPLSRVSAVGLEAGRPTLAGATPDLNRVVFEEGRNLTSDAPPQPPLCKVDTNFQTEGFFAFIKPRACAHRVYESEGGQVRLAGRIPAAGETSCDDSSGPACIAADSSIAWNGKARENKWNPHTISDGSDGHSRIFFTQPTDEAGHTFGDASELGEILEFYERSSGNLFVRTDATKTEQINVSERTEGPPSGFAPAKFLASTADGTRAFFESQQALTNGAMHQGGAEYLYMWSAVPDSEGHHLTLIDKVDTPDGPTFEGLVAISPDGTYAYFIDSGASLVDGFPGNNGTSTLYLWHSGKLTAVSLLRNPTEDLGHADSPEAFEPSAYVTDQGVLTYSSHGPAEFGGFKLFTGYESHCNTNTGSCRVLYDYNPQSNSLLCVSCDPSGEPVEELESTYYWSGNLLTGGTREAERPAYHPITEDGSRLFFTTQIALVPNDTNGAYDAYEYDPATGRAQLLSSGTSEASSFVTSEDGQGDNVFIGTRQPLVGWDLDKNYDIYDARIGGGFPEPTPTIAPCNGDSCRSATPPAPGPAAIGSTAEGSGNPKPKRRGKRHHRKRHHHRTAKHNRRAGR